MIVFNYLPVHPELHGGGGQGHGHVDLALVVDVLLLIFELN